MSPEPKNAEVSFRDRVPRPGTPVAHQLRAFQRQRGRLVEEGDFAGLAKEWGVPEARIRGVADFYDEFTGRPSQTDPPIGWETLPARGLVPEPRLIRSAEAAQEGIELALAVRTADRPAESLRNRLAEVEGLDRHRFKRGRTLAERWALAADTASGQRFIVCHADAGNPGTWSGLWALSNRSDAVLAGMALAALAVGAGEGVVWVDRGQPEVLAEVRRAIERATSAGLLGNRFEVSALASFGSDVGGEESALVSAIEGNRGEARPCPPVLEVAGLFGCPTVVEQAEVFALLPDWLRRGRDEGSRLVSLAPPFVRPGLAEIDASVSIRRVFGEGGGERLGGKSGDEKIALLLGGPFGSVLFPEDWDYPMDAEILAGRGLAPGHWGIEPLPATLGFREFAERILAFGAAETCGKCAPCRLGPLAALKLLGEKGSSPHRLREILDTITQASLCGFGRDLPRPLRQWLDREARQAEGSLGPMIGEAVPR